MNGKITLALLTALLSATAMAEDYEGYAKVERVTPQYERVNVSRQVCENIEADARPREYGGSILGGIAGAIVGNQVGGGNGRVAATAVGAITGAIVGDRIQNSNPGESRRCRNVEHGENRLTGYRVSYVYDERSYETIMPNDPGREMRVRVSVNPE
ncbi:MAG: glycine zipper 2TM domain-containing protein [Burkholderiales bacterium]|nr:glycine zipper 2TM domain-containing protein [Burkholderiales bacterium]